MDKANLLFYNNFLIKCNAIHKAPSIVAEEMGLKRSVVTAWKNGRQPRDATMQKVAAYFNCPVTDFLDIKKPPVTESDGRLEQAQELFDLLTDENKDFVLSLMSKLAGSAGQS